MKNLTAFVGWFLLALALCLYITGIYYAIFLPEKHVDAQNTLIGSKLPEPFDILTASIGAMLLTNLGAVLGISVTQPQSAIASKILVTTQSVDIPDPLTKKEMIQLIAVAIYLITLVACFVAWVVFTNQDNPKMIVPLVEQNGKNLIGVIAGYVAFIIGVNR